MAVSITICNLALGELRARPIAEISEPGLEALECRRYYPHVLRLALEDPDHSFSFATSISALVKLANNQRAGNWAYAYQRPADAGVVRSIIEEPDATITTYRDWHPRDWRPVRYGFTVEGSTIYTDLDAAWADYSIADLDESAMPAAFQDWLVIALAARLAVPIRNDSAMRRELTQAAETVRARAIADDRNRQVARGYSMEDEVALARHSWQSA